MIRFNLESVAKKSGYPTISSLSRATNRHINTIRLLWRGGTTSISVDVLDQLCEILRCQPGDLFEHLPD